MNFYLIITLSAFVWLVASASLAKLKRWKMWWGMMIIGAAGPFAFLANQAPDLSGPAMLDIGTVLLIGWGTVFIGLIIGGIAVLDARSAKSTATKKGL